MVDARIDVLDRGRVMADMNYVLDGASMATASNPDPEHEYAEFVVWSLVIDHPEGTVLWDTGAHPEAGEGYWPPPLYDAFTHVNPEEHHLEDDLAAAGYEVGDVDAVVTSHLHLDHAGGLYLFEGTDVPIYVHEDELKYAFYSAKTSEGSFAYLPQDFDRDLNWRVVHREREEHFTDVEFVHLPGHTPGLIGALIRLDGVGTIIVAGDQAYVEANYADEHELGPGLLWSSRHWIDSNRVLEDLERRHEPVEIVFGHDLRQFERIRGGWP